MFAEFLNIIFKSIKLDKTLYSDNKNFGEASIYFAGIIMILDGIAGAVAANTIIKTAIAMSGLTAIVTWLIWAIFIFVIGVKLFPDKQTKVSFKKVLTAVGFAHAPGLLRFFAVTPDLMIPIIFLTLSLSLINGETNAVIVIIPAFINKFATSPILLIFSSLSSSEKPRSLHKPCLILSPSKT